MRRRLRALRADRGAPGAPLRLAPRRGAGRPGVRALTAPAPAPRPAGGAGARRRGAESPRCTSRRARSGAGGRGRWEYHTAQATWREGVGWRLTLADGTVVDGLDGILNRYGAQGWELVGVLDDERRGVSAATAETVLIGITLVFKRPGPPGAVPDSPPPRAASGDAP